MYVDARTNWGRRGEDVNLSKGDVCMPVVAAQLRWWGDYGRSVSYWKDGEGDLSRGDISHIASCGSVPPRDWLLFHLALN